MIPVYRRILYATDLSVSAPSVFKHVIAAARANDARINILHVLPEVDAAMINYVATIMGADKLAAAEISHKDEVAANLLKRLKEFAAEELADHPEDLERIDSIDVLSGQPASTILSEARKSQADLLIIGTHGKGRLEYAFLGSVAQKIMRRAEIPVMLVPLPH
ncbi:universal stress protein [Geopsychrobacter electrodiphilus]|uniref:universal stress protein n=1 Tax=Geopsychrobacter electrodiphilus TaxID=225196 RepID=UPI0003625072|nr:universal stress protein [Geopsychrobacter electrodiphilus]